MKFKRIVPINEMDLIEVDMKNNDTIPDTAGDVVVIDTTDLTKRATVKTKIAGNTLAVGIRKNFTAVGEIGSVYVFGVGIPAKVKTEATDPIAVGDILSTSTTPGVLTKGTTGAFAVALEAVPVNTSKTIKVKIL